MLYIIGKAEHVARLQSAFSVDQVVIRSLLERFVPADRGQGGGGGVWAEGQTGHRTLVARHHLNTQTTVR